MFLTNNNMAQVLISPEGLGMASSFVDLGFSANKTGFYDRNKKLVIDLSSYGSAYPIGHFSGGYCTMQLGNPQGSRFTTIIDKSGNPMFEPLAGVSLGRFSQGRATKSGGASGFCYINASGEEVITGLEEGSDFAENGLALVKRRGEPAHCFIDVNGNRLGDSENPAVTNATGLASGAPSAVAASKTSEVTNATQPGPAQSKVLYEIDNWSPGSEWTLGGGWTIANSILVSDGSGHWSAFAPFVPSRSDYAVEAEVRIRAGDPSFQLLVRTVPDSANYSGGYDALSGQSSNPVIEFGSEVLAGSNSPAPPSDSWHTIRLEANGTSLRLVIDGVEVAGAVDTRLSEPGAVGLWFGDGCRVDVRSFRVIAI
jgi:hypothetical protein